MKRVTTLLIVTMFIFSACTQGNLAGSATEDIFAVDGPSEYEFADLQLREATADVDNVLTGDDLGGLSSWVTSTRFGQTRVNQFLSFRPESNTTPSQDWGVNFVQDEDDNMDDYLAIDTEAPFFQWSLVFVDGLLGEIEDEVVVDFTNKRLLIMGSLFRIDEVRVSGQEIRILLTEFSTGNAVELWDPTPDGGADGTVEINNENINDATLSIQATGQTMDGRTGVRLSSIMYQVTMDPQDAAEAYIAQGEDLRAVMERPESLLSSAWTVRNNGLETNTWSGVNFTEDDDVLVLSFQNNAFDYYPRVPLVTASSKGFTYGEGEDELYFTEVEGGLALAVDSFVVLTNGDDTSVLQYEGFDGVENVLEFTDVSSGGIIAVPLNQNDEGNITVNGKTFAVKRTGGDVVVTLEIESVDTSVNLGDYFVVQKNNVSDALQFTVYNQSSDTLHFEAFFGFEASFAVDNSSNGTLVVDGESYGFQIAETPDGFGVLVEEEPLVLEGEAFILEDDIPLRFITFNISTDTAVFEIMDDSNLIIIPSNGTLVVSGQSYEVDIVGGGGGCCNTVIDHNGNGVFENGVSVNIALQEGYEVDITDLVTGNFTPVVSGNGETFSFNIQSVTDSFFLTVTEDDYSGPRAGSQPGLLYEFQLDEESDLSDAKVARSDYGMYITVLDQWLPPDVVALLLPETQVFGQVAVEMEVPN